MFLSLNRYGGLAPSWRRLGHASVGVLDGLELHLPRRLGTIASVTAAGGTASWAEYVSAAATGVLAREILIPFNR